MYQEAATTCRILRLKCTEFDFRWRFPISLDVFNGPTSNGRVKGRKGNRKRKWREGVR